MEITFRKATITDIPFLVETIIEAEKAGTDIFPYSTIFELTEDESKKYITLMLEEEIDGCELSVSSFMVAVVNDMVVAALSAWVEGNEGLPSSVIKGNLLNYILPKHCIEKAIKYNKLLRELHIELSKNTIQIGAGYVSVDYRGNKILNLLNDVIIEKLIFENPSVTHICAQIYSCNIPSMKSYEKLNFDIVLYRESLNYDIKKLLPSNKKFLLTKKIIHTK